MTLLMSLYPGFCEKSVVQICFGSGSVFVIAQYLFSSIAASRIPFKFLKLASEIADAYGDGDDDR
jgi:hypothetical protein